MNAPLWTSEDAARATDGTPIGEWTVSGISIDTRSLSGGDLFVALKDQRDGHDFLDAAFDAGAGAALVERKADGRPALVVEDTLKALEQLGLAARARCDGFMAAVTGSVGKTSVKEMLAQIFRAVGEAHWSERSFNNHWGVPLTLARMPQNTERAIFEIGMNTPGEIAPRSRLVRPQAALITKIAPAHLEGVGSIEAVAEEKSDIFAGLEKGGSIIVPADDVFVKHLARRGLDHQPRGRIFSFGTDSEADARLIGSDAIGLETTVTVDVFGDRVTTRLTAIGDHWGLNAAAALLVAVKSGISAEDAADALSGYAPPAGRGTAEPLILENGDQALMIDDAYNANPESMRAAIAALHKRPATRKLVALGEMLELGPNADDMHAALAEPLLAANVRDVFAAGNGIRPLVEALPETTQKHHAVKSDDLVESLKKSLKSGDVLLIKGSNASGMGRLAQELRQWSEANARRVMGDGSERSEKRGNHAL